MSLRIPTAKELADQFITYIETITGQTVPLAQKAFSRALGVALGLVTAGLYKYGAERSKQNLAVTATGDDLDLLGSEVGVVRQSAVSTVLTAEIAGTDGVQAPSTVSYIGDANGVRYFPDSSSVVSGGVATLTLTAATAGVVGNLQIGDALNISAQIAGLSTVATVTAIVTTGVEAESEEVYRQRVLSAFRLTTGGGNAADYKIWAEGVEGVARAYPYAGAPTGSGFSTAPPDRTVYVRAQTAIDPDGLAPQSLLDDVREDITTVPTTGLSRQPLGLTDDTLYVESISRLGIYVTISGLSVAPDLEAQAKQDVEAALSSYLQNAEMFVTGIDFVSDRNDTLTPAVLSNVVTDALRPSGATAETVEFGASPSVALDTYTLQPGELFKLIQVIYA